MRSRFLNRSRTFLRSNLFGLIAIFIVLGGTAIALPGKNKVNSGDIKQGAVRTLDLRRGAVTKSKLRRNAVDGSRVRNNTITGDDVDESSLSISLDQGAIGAREEEDRERRITLSPAELTPATVGDPKTELDRGIPATSFDPGEDDSVGATLEVPLDRVEGTGLQVRLLWDAGAAGQVVWAAGFRMLLPGTPLPPGPPALSETADTSPGADTLVETTVLDVPENGIDNGRPLSLYIARNADVAGDTLADFARLRLVEIRYTATG
jgi:hypothetical protein